MKEFPNLVVLLDTGERRYAQEGEIYFWKSSRGLVAGPYVVNEDDDSDEWCVGPASIAIYKRLPEDTDGEN